MREGKNKNDWLSLSTPARLEQAKELVLEDRAQIDNLLSSLEDDFGAKDVNNRDYVAIANLVEAKRMLIKMRMPVKQVLDYLALVLKRTDEKNN